MRKKRNEESLPPAFEFPEKCWAISFKNAESSKEMIHLGHLNLIESEDSPERYVGAILFADDEQFGDVKNKPFPVKIIDFNHQTGAINFQILGATTLFAPNTPVPYQFVFTGSYQEVGGQMTLSGEGQVPSGFCPKSEAPGNAKSGLPGDEGDTVIWRSGGPTDPPHKPSR